MIFLRTNWPIFVHKFRLQRRRYASTLVCTAQTVRSDKENNLLLSYWTRLGLVLCEHEWVIGTFDVCVERTSRHLWPSVLDGDEIVPGWQWCVAELIAFIDLSTDQLDPWRTADVDCQGTAAGLGRVDDELTQLTYNRPQHTLTDRQIDRQLVPWDLVCIDVSQHCQSSVNQSNRDVVKWATSKTEVSSRLLTDRRHMTGRQTAGCTALYVWWGMSYRWILYKVRRRTLWLGWRQRLVVLPVQGTDCQVRECRSAWREHSVDRSLVARNWLCTDLLCHMYTTPAIKTGSDDVFLVSSLVLKTVAISASPRERARWSTLPTPRQHHLPLPSHQTHE